MPKRKPLNPLPKASPPAVTAPSTSRLQKSTIYFPLPSKRVAKPFSKKAYVAGLHAALRAAKPQPNSLEGVIGLLEEECVSQAEELHSLRWRTQSFLEYMEILPAHFERCFAGVNELDAAIQKRSK